MARRLTDQQLRELLEAALDKRTPLIDRRNAAVWLRAELGELGRELAREQEEGPTDDGEEPDRAAEYEQMRRELLEQRAAIEAEQAKLRELHQKLEGAEEVRPTETR